MFIFYELDYIRIYSDMCTHIHCNCSRSLYIVMRHHMSEHWVEHKNSCDTNNWILFQLRHEKKCKFKLGVVIRTKRRFRVLNKWCQVILNVKLPKKNYWLLNPRFNSQTYQNLFTNPQLFMLTRLLLIVPFMSLFIDVNASKLQKCVPLPKSFRKIFFSIQTPFLCSKLLKNRIPSILLITHIPHETPKSLVL